MISLRKTAIVALSSVGVVSASFVAPAVAGPSRPSVDAARLDATAAEYTQYRRHYGHRGHYGYRGGWRGPNRGAAIAAGVGLGILGAAAAAAASRPAYVEHYYYDDYYPAPVYGEPVYVAPRRYYAPGYYSYDFRDYRGTR